MKIKNKNSGFTLLELSVVILIIAILTTTILTGRSLIKEARLRSIIIDVNNLQSNINNFKLQYNSLPGDLSVAQNYWPTIQNGNGNGVIDNTESQTSFLMLYQAGYISNKMVNNFYYPSKYSSFAYYLIYNHQYDATPVKIYGKSGLGNALNLASFNSSLSPANFRGAISPADAYEIDTKIDDGILYSGNVYTTKGTNRTGANSCTTNATSYQSDQSTISTDSYYIRDLTNSCWMIFWIVD